MAKVKDRFEVIQTEGNGITKPQCLVLLDSVTGVQYLYVQSGNSGGLCPLVNRAGGPLTWDV